MRITLLALTLCAAVCTAAGQLSGTVTDEATGQPLSNANVFISGTSKGGRCNEQGRFELLQIPPGRFELIVSMAGYQTHAHTFETRQLPLQLNIRLKVKIKVEEAVTVMPFETNGWERWGRLFINNFLGRTEAAEECAIKNPGVLRFRYHKQTSLVEAVASDILIIENKALGYRIQYQLERFEFNIDNHSLLYEGYPLFEELNGSPSNRQRKARLRSYYGSVMHLMRSLFSNTLLQQGFEVWQVVELPNFEKQRVAALPESSRSRDSGWYYRMLMKEPDTIKLAGAVLKDALSLVVPVANQEYKVLGFGGLLMVVYRKELVSPVYRSVVFEPKPNRYQTSRLYFDPANPSVQIEANGNYFDPVHLYTEGYMGWEKMANLLPADYWPDVEKE